MPSFRYYRLLASAAIVLTSRLATKAMRRRAWVLLAQAFADVDLPEETMLLDQNTSKALRKVAARELRDAFEHAAGQTRNGNLSDEEFATLASRTNGLWRELAATSPQEYSEVVLWQRNRAHQIIGSISAEHHLDRDQLRDVLEQIAHDLTEHNERGQDVLDLLVQAGVPRKEFLRVINGYLGAS